MVLIDFPFQPGEVQKVRPALVVQGDAVQSINTIIAEISSNLVRVGPPTRLFIDIAVKKQAQAASVQLGRHVLTIYIQCIKKGSSEGSGRFPRPRWIVLERLLEGRTWDALSWKWRGRWGAVLLEERTLHSAFTLELAEAR